MCDFSESGCVISWNFPYFFGWLYVGKKEPTGPCVGFCQHPQVCCSCTGQSALAGECRQPATRVCRELCRFCRTLLLLHHFMLLPGPAPSHQASATALLGCWGSALLARPRCSTTWQEGKCEHRAVRNTCHMPPRDDPLLSLPSEWQKSSGRRRPALQLYQRGELSFLRSLG